MSAVRNMSQTRLNTVPKYGRVSINSSAERQLRQILIKFLKVDDGISINRLTRRKAIETLVLFLLLIHTLLLYQLTHSPKGNCDWPIPAMMSFM